MSLEQGVRYNIAATGDSSPRRANYVETKSEADQGDLPIGNATKRDSGLTRGNDAYLWRQTASSKQIDYILEAKDSNSDFTPNVFLSSGEPFDPKTLLSGSDLGQLSTKLASGVGHNGISFFGADQTTFSNIKYNETFSGIENDTMYFLSSNCTVIYNNTTYNYGSILNTNSSDTAFTKTGSPRFVEALTHGKNVVNSKKYYVYGSGGRSVGIGSSTFYPGDVFTSTGAHEIEVDNDSVDEICLIEINENNLKQWYSTSYSSSALLVNKTYLIYDNVSCIYNSSLIKPNPLLNNVFKSTTDSIYDQPGKVLWENETGRKKPIIREIIKSPAVKPGDEYYLFHDVFTGFGRSNTITYNDIQYSTVVEGGGSNTQPKFKGVNLRTSYSTGHKNIDKQHEHQDSDYEGEESQARNLDLASGNPIVLKKEPVGLKAGQKYVLVAAPIGQDSLIANGYYILSKGEAIVHNGANVTTGQVFKAVNETWAIVPKGKEGDVFSNGEEEVTLVTNKATVRTLENNGGPITLETTIKNRKVEFTASDNTVSPYAVTGSSPILYWTKDSGKPYIYKSVETLEENKRYYIAAEGDGFIAYPPNEATYSCERPDKEVNPQVDSPSDKTTIKLTKTELDAQKIAHKAITANQYSESLCSQHGGLWNYTDLTCSLSNTYNSCIKAEGEWVGETSDLVEKMKRYHNRESFYAIYGKCITSNGDRLWSKNTKDSCNDSVQAALEESYDAKTISQNRSIDEEEIITTWNPYTTFKEKKDSLFAYAITESGNDQSLTHQIEFREPSNTKPDDTKTPEQTARTYNVASLKQKLFKHQVLRFPQTGTKAQPTFVVGKDYSIGTEIIKGWLLYEGIPVYDSGSPSADLTQRTATASLVVDKVKVDEVDPANPFNLYYAEPFTLELDSLANEGSGAVTFTDNLPFDLNVGEFLTFEDSNNKLSQFKVTAKANAGTDNVTGLIVCPGTAQINQGSKAKVSGKKIGTYCLNKKFNNRRRFTGVSGKPIVRFKDRRKISDNSDLGNNAIPNIGPEALEQNAYQKTFVHKVVVKENKTSTPEAGDYSVGGDGFVTVGSAKYHAEAAGRITVNHPLANTNLAEYNNSKYTWYSQELGGAAFSAEIYAAPIHVPVDTKLFFPNGVFQLTQDLEIGSTSMVGKIITQVADRNRSPKRLYHKDESNFVFVAASEFTLSGSEEMTTDSNAFLYKSEAEAKYEDAKTPYSLWAEASKERFSIAEANQEYYIKVTPDEIEATPVVNNVSQYPIQEGLEYVVKATGETIELSETYVSSGNEEQELNITNALKETLKSGTVLVFYPADQIREIENNVASLSLNLETVKHYKRKYRARTPYDVTSSFDSITEEAGQSKTGGIRFTLTEDAQENATKIKGAAEAKARDQDWGEENLKGEELNKGSIAETYKEVVYNNRAFKAGETFVGIRNTTGTGPTNYTRFENSFINATKNEKVYAYNGYVDYYYEEEIFSGEEFNISLDLVTQDGNGLALADKNQFSRSDITGSQSHFDLHGAIIESPSANTVQLSNTDSDRRKHFYYLPPSPTVSLTASSAKIYKINYKYIDKDNSTTGSAENSYGFTNGVTYKVGGTGDGYINTTSNTVGKVSSTLSGVKTFYPSSPSVYDKTPTSLEPGKFYILEYPETFSDTNIELLSTLKYGETGNEKKYFSHNFDFENMGSNIKVKYATGETALRTPMLNSYIFGRSIQPFVQNVRNFNNNLGKPNFQKIDAVQKRVNAKQVYSGVILWEGLVNFNRYFDILDNSFETFSILRKEKYYNQWNKFKLAEQSVEGARTTVNIIGDDRIDYEYPLSFGIKGSVDYRTNIVDFSTDGFVAGDIRGKSVIRLVDSELLPSTVSDITYRVESSQESYFSAPEGSGIEAVRTLQPRPENRLKANNRYYLTGGSIKYLGYNSEYPEDQYGKGYLQLGDSSTSYNPSITIGAGKIFTGKADYFDGNKKRVYYGNSDKYVIGKSDVSLHFNAVEIILGTNHEDNVIENRLGTFEFWNHTSPAVGSPLVYPIIEQWEVEANKTYNVQGGSADRVEYDGKVYKTGETFKVKQLDFNQPFSGDQDMFLDMLSTADYKEAAARGLKPWMDESFFSPKERGYVPLTPLIYKEIAQGGNNIEANKKYIIYGSVDVVYDNETYKAKNVIAYPDNHFDATLATAYATNVRRKVRQNEKIETGVSYFVYGAGKVKYIEQITANTEAAHEATSIQVKNVSRALKKYDVLEFSNGSTFVLTVDAGTSGSVANLTGILTGKLLANSVAPIVTSKYNKQVTINLEAATESTLKNVNILPLPYNIPKGETLYFSGGGRLIVSENTLAGEPLIKGLVEGAKLNKGDTANIVYARQHEYKEYSADGEFNTYFTGLRGYDYFEITEGNPEIYTDENLTTTIGERYYVFGTSDITHDGNSVSPSNVFYGKTGETDFTPSNATVVEVVEPENLIHSSTYKVYGNSNILFNHYVADTGLDTSISNGSSFSWDSLDSIAVYKPAIGVQDPSGPVVYSKTLNIISPGETYKIESLGDSEPRGVVRYVEKSGTCYRPGGILPANEISTITDAQDCLLEDTLRANFSKTAFGNTYTSFGSYRVTVDADTGVQGRTPGSYSLNGLEFEVFINDFSKYEQQNKSISFTKDDVSYNHTIIEYKIIDKTNNNGILFFNGGVIVPSEDIWVEGKYVKAVATDPFEDSRLSHYQYEKKTCENDGGTWGGELCSVSGVGVNASYDGNLTYSRLNKGRSDGHMWISVSVKGEIAEPISIKQGDEAPLFVWKDDVKTAYFTTDGSSYTSGSVTTKKKSKNGQIETTDPVTTYTLAGGTEIRYGGETVKRGEIFTGGAGTFTGGSSTEWINTRNSDGKEYLTSAGSEKEFTGLTNYEEIEIISGNPQIFVKGQSFLVPEGNVDETYVLEGDGDIKVLNNENIQNISNITYKGQTNGSVSNTAPVFRADTGAASQDDLKSKSEINPRGVVAPTNLGTGYYLGDFDGVANKPKFTLRYDDWSSPAWVYHKAGAIRSAKMRTDSQWGTTIDLINDEAFKFNNGEDSDFLNSGITEAEDYIDIDVDDTETFDKTANSVLVFEGFKLPWAAKSQHSFPDITPYSFSNRSQFSISQDVLTSRYFNLFAARIAVGKDAVAFGRGEVTLYDYNETLDSASSPSLKSTTKIRAYSNLKTAYSSANTEGVAVTTLLTRDYRYVVTGVTGTPKVKVAAIEIDNVNGYHNQKPDGTSCTFGSDTFDYFNNEAINGIKFKVIGRKDVVAAIGGASVSDPLTATFASSVSISSGRTYNVGPYDDSNDEYITVSALPVDLEVGEKLVSGSRTLTISEKASQGDTSIKAVLSGASITEAFAFIKTVEVAITGTGIISEYLDGTFKSVDPSGNNLNCPTSIGHGQISSSLTGDSFSDEVTAALGYRFTAIMDMGIPSGVNVSFTNVVTKSFFELNHDDFIANPRLEYTEADPKFLFVIGAHGEDSDIAIPKDPSDYGAYEGSEKEDGYGITVRLPNFTGDYSDVGNTMYRHHLYDLNYGGNAATVTVGGLEKTAKNNFFIHDGTTDQITLKETNVLKKDGTALRSNVYIYKEVLSGEIEIGKKYIVYGTGLIVYEETQIIANDNFVPQEGDDLAPNCFKGGGSGTYATDPYKESFWNIMDKEAYPLGNMANINDYRDGSSSPGGGDDSVPVKHRVRRTSAPRVLELVFAGSNTGGSINLPDSAANNKGDIYYVFGEGGVTYNSKTIYAANKYIAVSGENYDDTGSSPVDTQEKCEARGGVWNVTCSISGSNKIEPSAVVYAGRIIPTIGHEYENYNGIINPIPKHHFFAENKYTKGNIEELDKSVNIDRDTDVVVYRKAHALGEIQTGGKYRVFSKAQSNGTKGTSELGTVDQSVPLNSIEYNSASYSPKGEVNSETNSASGGQKTNNGEITISSTATVDTISSKTLSKKPKFIMTRKRLSQMKRKGVFGGIRLDKCYGCFIEGQSWYIGGGTSVVRSQSEFYSTLYDASANVVQSGEALLTDSVNNKYQVGKPKGFTYTVRGGGSIKYPVNASGNSIGELTRVIPAGESFTPIENESSLGASYGYYKKETGQETVYRIADQEDVSDSWKGLDRFAGMAPDRRGTVSGEVKEGISYRVLRYEAPFRFRPTANSNTPKVFEDINVDQFASMLYIRGEKGDDLKESTLEDEGNEGYGRVKYNGKEYGVGKVFTGVSGVKAYATNKIGVFIREESGTYGNAPQEDWSNQWSMFMSQTVTSPSTTSLWHEGTYGDVLGFLNNRCHFYSLDFQSNKYAHLLQTFAYGIKPVIRSEAPSGYTYLEGSNAKQNWFASAWISPFVFSHVEKQSSEDGVVKYNKVATKFVDQDVFQDYLNMWFYRSCQVYKPDYPIDTVTCIDLGQYSDGIRLVPSNANFMQSGICVKDGALKDHKDADSCAKDNGVWMPLKDKVEIKLNKRLDHRPGTQKVTKNLSLYSKKQAEWIRHGLAPGPFNPEPFRTDENAVIEYLIKQRRFYSKEASTKDKPYFTHMPCHKARIGDSAPDISSWYHPDDPWGACDSRFYFTKQIPYAYDDGTDETVEKTKTPVELKPFQQMEFYLRAMAGGFIDDESNPKPLVYGGIEPGLLPSSVPVCTRSKDYEYLFENLAYQALNENDETEHNYKTVEMYHDSDKLRIQRKRVATIQRAIELNGGLPIHNYYEIYRGTGNTIIDGGTGSPGIAVFTPTGDSEIFYDIYEVTLEDDFKRPNNKEHRIPGKQKYEIVQRDSALAIAGEGKFVVTAGIKDTTILKDSQTNAKIEWGVGENIKYYILEKKISKMPHYSTWSQASAIRDVDALSEFPSAVVEGQPHVKTYTAYISPTEFEKIEFRLRVFYKEKVFDKDSNSKIIEAKTNGNITSPVTAEPIPLEDDSKMTTVSGTRFGDGFLCTATETFVDGARAYKIKISHYPNLWIGYSKATTLGGKPRLFYRIEYRTKSSYPDGLGQEGDWMAIARFDNPSTSTITYTDTADYVFENVSYRVCYVKGRLGGLRWISPLFRNDRMGKPNDPKGYGPLQNIKLRAALFNQFVNAVNLLKEVRIDLPITVRTKDITTDWVTPVTEVASQEEGSLKTYDGNPPAPTWGIYAINDYAKGPHHTFINWDMGDQVVFNCFSNEGAYEIGTLEGDESVESGWFGACAYKGYGFSKRPWIQGGVAYTALYFYNKRVKITVPNDQVAMKWAVPSVFSDMLYGKYIKLNGLEEFDTVATRFLSRRYSYHQAKYENGRADLAEKLVFCRSIDQTGFSKYGETVYGLLRSYERGEASSVWYKAEDNDTYSSRCGFVPGMAMLEGPHLDTSDNAIFIPPMGWQSGQSNNLVCTPGGSASSHCFTSRAGTGDNNMKLEIEVVDSIGYRPFNSKRGSTGRYYMMLINIYQIVLPKPNQ